MSIKATKWYFSIAHESGLNASERLVLQSLCFHHHPKTGGCYPSVETIAADAGLSERPTQAALRSLADRGLIKIRDRFIGGRQATNQYDLFGAARGAATSTPKRGLRGAKKSTPPGENRGVLPAAPNRVDLPLREKSPAKVDLKTVRVVGHA